MSGFDARVGSAERRGIQILTIRSIVFGFLGTPCIIIATLERDIYIFELNPNARVSTFMPK